MAERGRYRSTSEADSSPRQASSVRPPRRRAADSVLPAPVGEDLSELRVQSDEHRARAVLELQRKYGNQHVRRILQPPAQVPQQERDEASDQDPSEVSPDLARRIQDRRGEGQPLDPRARADLEQICDRDFGEVRVHTGPAADAMNRAVEARAFTVGRDIFFRQRQYAPDTTEGKRLLAHELTHVTQQHNAAVAGPTTVTSPKDPSEVEAEQVAEAVPPPRRMARVMMPSMDWETGPEAPAAGMPEPAVEEAEAGESPDRSVVDTDAARHLADAAADQEGGSGDGTPPVEAEKAATEESEGTDEVAPPPAEEATEPEPETRAEAASPEEEKDAAVATADEASAPASPQDDSAFQTVTGRIRQVASQERAHPPARASAGHARAAASSPSNEAESLASVAWVQEIEQQRPRPFERTTFREALLTKLAGLAPKTLKEAEDFKDSNRLASVTSDLTQQFERGQEQSLGPIEAKVEEAPDPSGIDTPRVDPLEPPAVGDPPPEVGAAQAVPRPKLEATVAAPFQAGSQELDQQMAEAEITEEQLEISNELEFQAALESKWEAQADAAQAPARYRLQEREVLSQARAEAERVAQAEIKAMHADREQLFAQVAMKQEEARSEVEQKRAEVADRVESTQAKISDAVAARLLQLDQELHQVFLQGTEEARQFFEDYVDRHTTAYKEERYSGLGGMGRWVRDRLAGVPPEVNQFYFEGHNLYIKRMGVVIDQVVSIMETGLTEAREIITAGRQEIQEYVDRLPHSLREVGQEATASIQGRFSALEQSVDDRQDELIDHLALQYQQSLNEVKDRIEELKAANRGLVDEAFDAVAGVAQTILQTKDMLLNVLSQAAEAVSAIIKDPIGFLDNLIDGVKQGLYNFVGKIGEYLKEGLIGWLTGTLATAGIQLPQTWDLKGIFSLVMQVLGLTYQTVRVLAVKALGERVVSDLEMGFDIFKTLVTEGVAGLWNFIADKVGDLKALVLDQIRDLLITKVIKAGIRWLLGMLTPAGAFIKAAKAIYGIVKFFVTDGKEVLELVGAVAESVVNIAQGNVAAAAQMVESALAKSVPVVISFLANLLGLSGLADKVKGILDAVRRPILQAIEWVIEQARTAACALGGLLGLANIGHQHRRPEHPQNPGNRN